MVDFNNIKEQSTSISLFDKINIDRMRTFISHFLYSFRYSTNEKEQPFMYGHEPEITFKDRDRHYGVKIIDGMIHLYYKSRLIAKFDYMFENVILYPFDTRPFTKDNTANLEDLKKTFRFSQSTKEEIDNFFSMSHLYPSLATMVQIKSKNKSFNIEEKYHQVKNLVLNADSVQDNNWFTDLYTKDKKPYFFLNLDKDFIDTILKYKKPYKELTAKLSLIATHYDNVNFIIEGRSLSIVECKRIFSFFRALSEYDDFVFTFKKCNFTDGKSKFIYNGEKNTERIVNKLITEQKQLFDGFYYKVEVE